MIIIEILLLVLLVLLAMGVGAKTTNSKTKMPKHEHAWGEWELGSTKMVDQRGNPLYTQTTQSRSCIGCNYTEKEAVRTGGV